MNVSSLKAVATKSLAKGSFKLRHYSPEILTVVGIAGVITAGVLAARATLKLEETIDRGSMRLAEAADDQNDRKKVVAYSANVLDVVKLYGPSVTLGVASIACIVGAHGIMRKRNVALVGAYKALETTYNTYRSRVREELGEEKERDLALGVRTVEEKDEAGKKILVKELIDPNARSDYARFFDEMNDNWSKIPDQNYFFIKAQQNIANNILQARGYIFLNEVYNMLGIEPSQAGQIVGWATENGGDEYIDFGIFDVRNRDFVNGNEKSILLDFNVDGTIIGKL